MPDFVLGMNAKIYQGTAGDPIGSLAEMTNVKDVTLNLEAGEADVTTRANSGWRGTAASLRQASVDFEMVWKAGDAGFDAIKTAFLTSATLELAVMDGSSVVSGNQGLIGTFGITSFSRSEPLEEAISVSVSAKLITFAQWLTVS